MIDHERRRIHRRRKKRQLRINKSLKRSLYKNISSHLCYYCKNTFDIGQLTIEHIIPLSCGGSNHESNITLACAPCNQLRGRESFLLRKAIRKAQYEQHSQ